MRWFLKPRHMKEGVQSRADKITAHRPAIVDAFRMVHLGKAACKKLGQSLQLPDHVFTLIGLERYPWVRLGDNFELVASQFSAFECRGSRQMWGDFFKEPVCSTRGHKPERIVFQGTGRLRGRRKLSDFSRYLRIPCFLGQAFVKSIHLPLAEPVALVFQFIGSDPGIVQDVLEIEVRMKFLNIFHIVLDQPAVVKRSVYVAECSCLGNHLEASFRQKVLVARIAQCTAKGFIL